MAGPSRRPSSSSAPHRMSRETAYRKTQAKAKAEAQARNKRAAAAQTADEAAHVRKSYANATPARSSRQLEKTRAVVDDPHPFRYKSFNDRLNAVHVSSSFSTSGLTSGRGSTLAGLDVQGVAPSDGAGDHDDAEDEDEDMDEETRMARLQARTAFGAALQAWRELNLSVPFQAVLRAISRQSQSLTMLIHHRDHIAESLAKALRSRDAVDSWLAYEPCLDLFPRLALDLHQEFLPIYPLALDAMLNATMISKNATGGDEQAAARVVEKGFEAVAALFRNMAPLVAKTGGEKDWMVETWTVVRPYMGYQRGESEGGDEDEDGDDGDEEDDDDDGKEVAQNVTSATEATASSRRRHAIPPHVRRFASEAFAHLLRRCKQSQLSKTAALMLADAQQMLDGDAAAAAAPSGRAFATAIAGIWSELIKGVDKRLHSQCQSQISALLDVSNDKTQQATTLVGNLLLTSLVHHGQAAHLVPLYEILLQWCEDAGRARDSSEALLVQRTRWLTTAIATRKGNRVDESVKPRLFAFVLELTKISDASPRLSAATAQLVAFALPIGRIPDLVGPGIKIMTAAAAATAAAQAPSTASRLPAVFTAATLSLAQLDSWRTNFRQFILPTVMSATADALERADARELQDDALHLLARLVEMGNVTDVVYDETMQTAVVARWKRVAGRVVLQRLQELAGECGGDAVQPTHIVALPLVPLFARSDQAAQLATALRSAIAATQQRCVGDSATTPLNAPMLLALLATALTGLLQAAPRTTTQREWLGDVCTTSLAGVVLQHLTHHRAALVATLALYRLAASVTGDVSTPPLADVAPQLCLTVMSHDDELRAAAVGWLAVCADAERGASSHARQLTSAMATIESIPLRVETVRDRNVRLRSLVRDVVRFSSEGGGGGSDGDANGLAVLTPLLTRYVVGTLKLNFKPVWEESRKALADMVAARMGDEVWRVAFEELTSARGGEDPTRGWAAAMTADQGDVDIDETAAAAAADDGADESAASDPASFADPTRAARAHAIRANWTSTAHSSTSAQTTRELIAQQRPRGRLELPSYRAQILQLFSELPQIVEKHNAAFVDHFFGVVEEDKRMSARGGGGGDGNDIDNAIDNDIDNDDDDANTASPASPSAPPLTVRERQLRLTTYLSVFNKFSNPKALFRSSDLHEYFYALAASGEQKLQRLALECIFTWKNPSQMPYSDKLFALLDQGKFREELAGLELSADNSAASIQPHDREAVMPLVLRVLFGLAISRKGRNSAATSGAGKKVAILNALAGCSADELAVLVELMMAPLYSGGDKASAASPLSPTPTAYPQQQLGFLAFLHDVIKHLGAQVLPHWPRLVAAVINLAHHASLRAAAQGPGKASAVSRDIRQNGIRRLADFFRCPASTDFDWSSYVPVIFSTLVTPRLATFAGENIQSPSALLDLFVVWSTRTSTLPLYVVGDDALLPALYACLAAPTVKNAVVAPILDIVERIIAASEEEREEGGDDVVTRTVLVPFIPSLVASIAPALQRAASTNPPDALLQREIQLLARLAVFVTRSEDATLVLDLLGPMMRKSNRIVPEKSKSELLATFRDLLLLTDTFQDPSSELFARYYDLFSTMWSTLRSRNARANLGGVFQQIARVDGDLARVAGWVGSLNAFSERRLDEVDFDKRLDVFDLLSGEGQESQALTLSLSHREWQPLVHNMLFFIQDAEELVLRTNANAVLKRFVAAVEAGGGDSPLRLLFNRAVYPALRKTLRARSEQVRREVISAIGYAVRHLADSTSSDDVASSSLSEMQGLLAGGDEEANFFNNIHHIQLHRRARALRRLADHAETGALRSKTLSEVLIPLVGHFIEDGHTEIGDHNLTNETVTCIGRLARQLAWGSYNAVLWKYLRAADAKGKGKAEVKSEKVYVRVAMAILDNFHFAMDAEAGGDDDGGGGGGDKDQEEPDEVEDEEETARRVAAAAAQSQKVITSVTTKLLPALMGYLEHHDDDTDDAIRLPIAVGVVRVVECLPVPEKEVQLAKLLNVLSNVFRSKSQETRDLARETLCKIAVALSSERLPQIVNEMRRSLTRGPQLAVLAYNVHAVLVHLMNAEDTPALTYLEDAAGIDDIVHIASEDIFGHTAEDREAIEYKTKQREMRQSKSLDTFEQLAKVIAPHRINAMILPLRNVMSETETPRAIKAVEDAMRRIASGINANEHFDHGALLGLCHSLISRNAAFLKPRKGGGGAASAGANGLVNDTVLMKRKDVEDKAAAASRKDHYATNAFRFVAFGLDLLVTALRRTRFDFASTDVLARLDPLVGAVGNTLYSADGHVLTLGLRAAGGLLRCPLPSLKASLPIFVRQTLQIVNREANPASDASQAGLRTLTTMLRDCPQAEFKEKQLADLLTLCLPEIEEPQAQSSIFGLLRAILGRRFVVVEVYDVMDKVAEMMVTNQSAGVRESCRAIFLQFLLDYPQGKGRLRNQMEFLAKNLSYVFESGRMSVMELLSAVLAKFSDDVLKDYSELLFVALVMVIANDDQTRCREKAAELGKALLGLVDDDRRERLIAMTHSWAANAERNDLSRVGLQVYGLVVDSRPATGEGASPWAAQAMRNARKVLAQCAEDLEEAEQEESTSAFAGMDVDVDLDWQLAYHALQAISKLGKYQPDLLNHNAMWTSVRRVLLWPHAWVRAAACRLLGTLYAQSQPPKASDDGSSPLSVVALVDTAKKLSLQLKGGDEVDDALGLQIVKNLLWIGKAFAAEKGAKQGNAQDADKEADDVDGDDSDDEEDGEEETAAARDSNALANPIAWLMTKLSYRARNLQGATPSSSNPSGIAPQAPTCILRLFAALSQHLEPAQLTNFLPHIVTPIYRITSNETLKGPMMEGLKSLAEEVQELLTECVGSNVYSAAYAKVRARATEKRRQRKAKQAMRAVGGGGEDDSGDAARRAARNEAKHASRKRKNAAFAKDKVRSRPMKRHRG